jgi:plastocyanin
VSALRSATRALVALAGAAALLGACATEDSSTDSAVSSGSSANGDEAELAYLPNAVQELDIVGDEYAFEISPDASGGLRPGWTTVSFHNDGVEAHQVMFARLKDGVDLAELSSAAGGDSSGAAAIEYVDMLGGVSYIGPGQSITTMVDLPAGTVMAMCYVPDPAGTAHALLGMSTVITVDEVSGSGKADASTLEPAATAEIAGTIELAADGYRLPESLPAGWYRVINTDRGAAGEGLHELSILRLRQSTTDDDIDLLLDDLANNTAPEIPLEALGGQGAISAGFEGYLYLDLPPGDYLAVDFMPDPRNARPHLLDGYYATFNP